MPLPPRPARRGEPGPGLRRAGAGHGRLLVVALVVAVVALVVDLAGPVLGPAAPAGAATAPSRPLLAAGSATPVDVVVVGASSGGVGAALGAAEEGADVLVLEPSSRPGGMLTNGVTTDMFDVASSSGAFERFRVLVAAAYQDHPDAGLARQGLVAEPDVALAAVERLLDHPRITVRTGWRIESAEVVGDELRTVTATDGTRRETFSAGAFVDATPEGDLLGAAGEQGRDWVVGREGVAAHGERLAPAAGDARQQAYNYRFTVQVGGRTDYRVPRSYAEDARRFDRIDRAMPGQHRCTYTGDDGRARAYHGMRIQRCMPDRKMDINVDLVGYNHRYVTDSPARRAVVQARMREFSLNYLHYLRTRLGYPELGLPDDYADNGGLPHVLYVREGRRLVGRDVFAMTDAMARSGSDRPAPQVRSVATGDYGMDSHCVGPKGFVSGQRGCTGAFWVGTAPYQIGYDVMVPVRLERLLAPVPVSATHVGYSTLRMEPVRMNLGYAAGVAAAMSVRDGVPVADVDVAALQEALVRDGQYLVFFRDLPPTDPGFAAAQLRWVGAPLPRGMLLPAG